MDPACGPCPGLREGGSEHCRWPNHGAAGTCQGGRNGQPYLPPTLGALLWSADGSRSTCPHVHG
eukprot:424746-Prorocentrum_lima.AAC.1